jgi:FkbM family methyltransferase
MNNLIFDLGVSDGNDTFYYLEKGFDVVGVEADPDMCVFLNNRFKSEVEQGRLIILNNAASDVSGNLITINVHQVHQGISGINIRSEPGGYRHHQVKSIDWSDLIAIKGVPRYMKIDIEGSEGPFLKGMSGSDHLPEFISIEAYQFEPIEMLKELGYSRFAIIDQNPEGGLRLPGRQFEGKVLESADFTHASGPFGLDIFNNIDAQSFEQISETWKRCSENFYRTWYDCHAWRPQ